MANKINDTTVYPNTTPALTDHFIGTDVSDTGNDANGEAVTFTFQAAMDLFEANGAAPSTFISSGTFANARISEASVTQHQAALVITESQISDLGTYQPLDPFLTDIANLTDPGADRILFWDDSAGDVVWLTVGSNLSITGTTLNASTSSVAFEITADSGTAESIAASDTITFAGGTGIGTTVSATDRITIGIDSTVATLTGSQTLTNKTIDTASNTITIVEADISDFGTYETADADILKADTSDNLTVGYTTTSNNLGTVASGTTTLAFADGQVQRLVNGGAFTLAPPALGEGTMVVEITNNASAGAITVTGFTSVTPSTTPFDTTDGNKFLCSVAKISGTSWLSVIAASGNA